MKYMERFEKMDKEIKKHLAMAPKLETELDLKKAKQVELEDEALKAEILEEEDWQEKKNRARRNREEIIKIEAELKNSKKIFELIKKEMDPVIRELLKEVRGQYGPLYEKAIKAFLIKLKEAEKLEHEIAKIEEEAISIAHRIKLPGEPASIILPPLNRVLMKDRGNLEENSGLNQFIKDCKNQGINIG